MDLTIKNYRCFPDSRPARITIRPGFSAFVGANNSGKSSLLRFFYEFRGLFQILSDPQTVLQFIRAPRTNGWNFNPAPSVQDLADMFCDANDRNLTIDIEFMAQGIPGPGKAKLEITVTRASNQFRVGLFIPGAGQVHSSNNIAMVGDSVLQLPTGTVEGINTTLHVELPPFFRTCTDLHKTLYIGPFRNAINVGTGEQYFDIQVGQSFVKSWRTYKTGPIRSENEAAWRLSDSIARIFEIDRLEINPSPDDRTLQVFINGKSYKLNEIGSGLTQFVIVLVNAAIKKPSYILIDEPELSLHPSLQVDFLTTLTSYSERGVLFSTHNMGLARASAERVYAVRRLAQSESEVMPIEALPRLSDFVGELGFSAYKELGFDKILLVEGPTEVRTIQQFLRLLKKEHRIVIIPLGGSSLINRDRELELQEIKRITPNIKALIDSERDSAGAPASAERQAFQDVCRKADIPCHVLDRRATENYLVESAVKRVKGPKYTALTHFQKLEDVPLSWSKSDNWRIAREMDITDIEKTDLGQFLQSL